MYIILEEDLEDITEGLRGHTLDSVKMEPIPWVQSHLPEIDKLYTELTVEKIENEPTGPENEVINDYRELFVRELGSAEPRKRRGRFRKRENGKRFLVKADPGLGKTTFCKKIAWDHAKGHFKSFSIVFFVRLKLVKPGQSIEDVLIQQCPSLRQQGVGPHDVRQLLDKFGEKCLIIVDGVDEFGPQKNKNVMALIRGEVFPQCSLLMTSRPHAVTDIDRDFENVLQIKGFSKEHVEEFCTKALKLKDQKKDAVVLFYENNFMGKTVRFASPMLLQFICILAGNDPEMNLAGREVARGDIYWRLVRCIYRKYCEYQNDSFKEDELILILDKIGKFALKTLKDRQNCFQCEEIIRELGENAFQLGFLVGHEDFRLAASETADIAVAFLHEMFRPFFAYFHLHQRECSGETKRIWNTVCSKDLTEMFDNTDEGFLLSKCIKDSDCLHFYLSLSKRNESAAFGLELIVMFIRRLFHCKTLDFRNTHRINIFQAIDHKDDLCLTLLRKVLAQCGTPENLTFSHRQPSEWILESLYHIRDQIKVIKKLGPFPHHTELLSRGERKALFDVGSLSEIASVVRFFPEPFDLVVNAGNACGEEPTAIDLSEIMVPGIRQMHIINANLSASESCEASRDLQHCSKMTHLVFNYVPIEPSLVFALSEALQKGCFPLLEHVSFEGCSFVEAGDSSPGNPSEPGCLTVDMNILNREHCLRGENALYSLFLFFSNIRSLVLSPQKVQLLKLCPCNHIRSLWLHDLNTSSFKSAMAALNSGCAPNLTELGLSLVSGEKYMEGGIVIKMDKLTHLSLHNVIQSMRHLYVLTKNKCLANLRKLDISHSLRIIGVLSILLCHSFPSLDTLILSNCGLNSQDLECLAKANVKGRLPELRHLDISKNILFNNDLGKLFDFHCKWGLLQSLNVEYTTFACFNDLNAKVKSGCLSALRDLRVCTDVGVSDPTTAEWPSLTDLQIHSTQNLSAGEVYSTISELIHRNRFRSLKTIHLTRRSFAGNPHSEEAVDLLKELDKGPKGNMSLRCAGEFNFNKDNTLSKSVSDGILKEYKWSFPDDMDPTEREDLAERFACYVSYSLSCMSERKEVPDMGPLLQYNVYDSYRFPTYFRIDWYYCMVRR